MGDKTLRDHRTRRKSTMPTLLSSLMSFLLLTMSLPASAIGQLSETSALPYAPASEQMRVLADFGDTADVVLRDGDYLLSEHSGTALIALPEDGDMASAIEYYSDIAEKASADGLLSVDAKSTKTASTKDASASTSAKASSSSEKATQSEFEMDADESIALVPTATSDVNPLVFLPATEDEIVATSEEPAPAPVEENTPAEPNAPPLVAIIDTGVSADIPVEYRSSVLAPQDPEHPEEWGLDDNGHGTAVAEAVLAENPAARLMSIKALDDAGYGSVSGVYAAIELAVANDADIINLSLSGRAAKGNEMLEEAVADAIASGVVVIASAGNGGYDAKYYTPANIDGVFTVGAANEDGIPRADSNRGKCVDAYVPAESTSFAAARVSGMASLYPGVSLENVAALLLPVPVTADDDEVAADVPVAAAEEELAPSEAVSIDVPTSAATPAIKTSNPSSAEDDVRAADAVKAEIAQPAAATETSEKATTSEEQEQEEATAASTSQATEKPTSSKESNSDTTKLQAASTSTSSPRRAPAVGPFTVSFNLNSNTSTSEIPAMTTEDGKITLPMPNQNASLFLYWTADEAGEGDPLMPGESYTPTANATLYAQWLDEALLTGITTENSSQLLLSALLTALVAMAAALLIRNGSRKTKAILR